MEPIGQIVTASGQVSAQSETGVRPLETGSPIHSGDVLVTGPDSRFEAKFADDSVLSQGPDAKLTVDQFIFDTSDPTASSFIANLTQGTFRLVTGKIADDNPDGVSLNTPLASIGIRGTGVDAVISGQGEKYGIFSYDHLDLVVATAQGTSFITQAGMLVDVGPTGAIGAPRPYSAQEIQMFQTAAPIVSVPGLQELSPDDAPTGEEGEGQGEGQGEGEGEAEGEGGEAAEGEAEGEGEGQGDELADVEAEGEGQGDELAGAEAEAGEEADAGEVAEAVAGETGDMADELTDGELAVSGEALGDATGAEALAGNAATGDMAGDVMAADAFTAGSDPFDTADAFDGGTDQDTLAGGGGAEEDTSTQESVQVGNIQDLLGYVPDFDAEDDDDDDDTLTEDTGDDFDASLYTFYIGTSAGETITGSSGRDAIIGMAGDDMLEGGDGDDFLIGDYPPSPEGDVPNSSVFDDTLYSTVGGNDTLIGGAGNDEFLSGKGADVIIGDYLSGTTYTNTVIYDRPEDISGYGWGPTGVHVNLEVGTNDTLLSSQFGYTGSYGTATDEWGDTDTLVGIQEVDGSYYADTLIGCSGNNELWGLEGDDFIFGKGGDDQIGGDEGNDTLYGGDTLLTDTGNDSLMGGAGNDWLYGGGGNDSLWGDVGADMIFGGAGSDSIGGGDDADTIYGSDSLYADTSADTISGDNGNDYIYGAAGNDQIWGGEGDDWISGNGGNDSIGAGAGSDDVSGGDGDDTIYGDYGNDILYGGAGQDSINGGEDNDAIHGDDDGDILSGDAGDDSLYGDLGDDTIDGGAGDDWIEGGAGADSLYGGEGYDTLSYENSSTGVIVALDYQSVSLGDAANDSIGGFEAVRGSYYADTITGDNGNNVLDGAQGADTIEGGLGSDLLDGADDADTLDAGSDAVTDYFYWEQPSHGNASELIKNFDSGEDKLAFLSTYFDSTGFISGSYAGAYNGNAGLGSSSGYFVYDTYNNTLYYDSDGDGSGTGAAIAVFDSGTSDDPTANDFQLVDARADVEALLS